MLRSASEKCHRGAMALTVALAAGGMVAGALLPFAMAWVEKTLMTDSTRVDRRER